MADTLFKAEGKTLTVERVFSNSRERIWKAFTTADELVKWWGPRGFETTVKELDFTEGGRWHYGMKCVDPNMGEWFGKTSWGISTYSNIDAPHSYVYTDSFSDEDGNIDPNMPTMVINMKFEQTPDGKTKVTSYSEFASEADLQKLMETGMEQGLKETWDRLEELVSKEA